MSAAALIAAIRATLLAHGDVIARLGDPPRVYDEPPPDPIFPYVTLGRVESRPADCVMSAAHEYVLTLHVWSRYGGRQEALEVVASLRAALHDAPISVPDHELIFLFAAFADVFRSGDGRTTHGVLRLRAMLEEAP